MSIIFQGFKKLFVSDSNKINNINECKNNNDEASDKNSSENNKNYSTNYSPEISFTRLPMMYRSEPFSENWNGLKLSLDFKPTQFFSLDYSLNIEKNKKLFNNYALNCSSYIPFSIYNLPMNLILIGNKAPSRVFNFQSHLMLGQKDKLTIVSNNEPKDNSIMFNVDNNINSNDENLSINKDKNNEIDNKYSVEYTHEFSNGNIGLKVTNLEPNSINFLYSIYHNFFFGMEFFKNQNNQEKYHFLKANYGLFLKQTPKNKFGFSFNYISTLPGAIFNCCYQINNNFKLYLNTLFNKNELLLKLGQEKFTASVSSYYKNNFIEMNSELNYKGEIKLMNKFFFNRYIDILFNFIYDHNAKKVKKKFKCFGFGLNIKNKSVEEKIEELIENQKKKYTLKNKNFFNYNNIMKSSEN